MPRRKPDPDPYDPRAHGCMCRVCRDIITVDPATLTDIPDEIVDTFEQGAGEATHASAPGWPVTDADAYVRGGIAAIWPEIEQQVRAKVAAEISAGLQQLREDGETDMRQAIATADSIARGEGK